MTLAKSTEMPARAAWTETVTPAESITRTGVLEMP